MRDGMTAVEQSCVRNYGQMIKVLRGGLEDFTQSLVNRFNARNDDLLEGEIAYVAKALAHLQSAVEELEMIV